MYWGQLYELRNTSGRWAHTDLFTLSRSSDHHGQHPVDSQLNSHSYKVMKTHDPSTPLFALLPQQKVVPMDCPARFFVRRSVLAFLEERSVNFYVFEGKKTGALSAVLSIMLWFIFHCWYIIEALCLSAM